MKWPWTKRMPVSRDVLDEPRLTMRGSVTSHDADSSGKVQVRLRIADSATICVTVESNVARRLPVGQRLRLVIEREP